MARSTTSPRTEIPTREASDPPDDVDIWQRWTVGIRHASRVVAQMPTSGLGQTEKNSVEQMFSGHPDSGHCSIQSACLKGANNGSSLLTHRLVGERDKASAGRQAERRSLGTPHGLAPWSADSSASRPKKNVFRLMGWSKLVISFWCDGLVRGPAGARLT